MQAHWLFMGMLQAFGFIEGVMKETLENTSGLKAGQDFGLAYIPVHNSEAKISKPLANLELKIAAIEKQALTQQQTF